MDAKLFLIFQIFDLRKVS